MTANKHEDKNAVKLHHVKKTYDQEVVVKDLSLAVDVGEFFVLVGASGSGKTTTLKMINRLVQPESGQVFVQGTDIAQQPLNDLRHRIGYVLQSSALFPNMTVFENAAVTLNAVGVSNKQAQQRIETLLTEVGLDPERYLNRYPDALSGGEKQRVGIVRALAAEPDLILMDEPFSALDPISRKQLQNLISEIHQRYQTTIIFVTHDMNEALRLGDRIAVMHAGELLQVGRPEQIVQHPANSEVRALFEGQTNAASIADLVAQGYYQVEQQGEYQALELDATLSTLAQMLVTDSAVLVDRQYLITVDDYLRYMAQN
ncbi:ABC transporter ATP-binding protein [Weissella minor]|uniref:ABC-type quaternary amine transporter n=1 Tax=Weissella minor TaxID=1620 RepID=A0A0R2JHN7_9LACO|nr:ABC transporter ATP-binding protein [Weissella minor]KRN76857.1 glycine betaine transport atp-binding protein [Weissella minor]